MLQREQLANNNSPSGGRTNISDEFEGCDYDNAYKLDSGLIFICSTYSYSYSYRPDVRIVVFGEGAYLVQIAGNEYSGALYRQ